MRKRGVKPDTTWPQWMHSPSGESRVFEKFEDVPEGWINSVGEVYEKPLPVIYDYDELVRQLTEKNIEINPIWGTGHLKRILDGDISPTG